MEADEPIHSAAIRELFEESGVLLADHTLSAAELTESCWMPAAEILKARKNKAMKVPYPTRETLKRLAKFDATSPMLEWARACGEKGVICDQPAFSPDEFA